MPASKPIRYTYWGAEVLLLAGALFAAVWFSTADEWQPAALVALVLVIGLLSETLTIVTSDGTLNPSLVAFVLAMGLLGPGPAMACGIAVAVAGSIRRRLSLAFWLGNLAGYAVPAFAGAWMVRALETGIHTVHNQQAAEGAIFALIVFGAFLLFTALNFVLIGLDLLVEEGRSFGRQVREFAPLASAELATGAIATIAAVAYRSVGLAVLFAAIGVLLIFRHLTVALMRSEERAEQLEARSRQLVGLQLGVLRTLVRALGMRDKTTGRHAAAVARYARDLAIELGCDEEERDMIHAAGLLHEIGKFTWPDRVLHADVIQEEDLPLVKNHPQEGSVLVGALDGYGPVADAILYHRERMDGSGYPAGLIGKEIPLGSRILAICSTYDTITAPDGYRSPMDPEEAMQELRHGVRNGQFDGEIVERFIALLEREGATFAQHADFETELEFERRVRQAAEPRSTSPAGRTP
ncbi:MAG TPA: HD domain-containing phosphohydrolase [Solirubrobacteraceae bacterium]|jgi:HD-GYP domain-containing protein (c-di-GMP phosphodiesterase class II)|nr:HD domain-containing phosphohydrolase [Solirubrobacteraceae bacterium]